MKIKKNKKIKSILSILLLIAVVGTSALICPMSSDAAGRFPGIDILINQNTAQDPFTVLEVVANKEDANVGFYFKGNEPFGIDEEGYPVSFEEAIVSKPTATARTEYVSQLLTKLSGMYYNKTNPVEGTSASQFPLVYTQYEETYFLEGEETGWTKVDLGENNVVQIEGTYEETGKDENDEVIYGDYIKSEGSYSIAPDGKGNYVENIAAFTVGEIEKNYLVTFSTTINPTYSHLGVYLPITDEDGNPTGEFFCDGLEINPDSTATYYYVSGYTFSPKTQDDEQLAENVVRCAPVYKAGEEKYVSVTEGTGTHIKEEGSFVLLPGLGTHNFVPSESGTICNVEVEAYYYKGGFTNNNWFKEKVFTLDAASINLNLFSTSVKTLTANQLTPESFEGIDLLVISGTADNASAFASITEPAMKALEYKIEEATFPCVINSELMATPIVTSHFYKYLADFYNIANIANEDGNFVNGSVYWHTGNIFNLNLGVEFTAEQAVGFDEITKYIDDENKYLELKEIDKSLWLEKKLSQAVAIQYVLSRQSARNITNKEKLTILEIEPCSDYFFKDEVDADSKYDKVRTLTGYTADEMPNDNIEIVQMTTAEFIGKIEDLNGTYDFIYIGMETGMMNTDANGSTVYNDPDMNGYVYTHTGDIVIAAERLAGLLDTDYIPGTNNLYSSEVYKLRTALDANGKLQLNAQTVPYYVRNGNSRDLTNVTLSSTGVYRYSGNDITEDKMNQLMDYLNAGYPIVVDEEFYKVQTEESTDGTSTEVRLINDNKVDNSSYIYEFLQRAWNRDNLFFYEDIVSKEENSATSSEFAFYMAIPKLKINFDIVAESRPADLLEGNFVPVADDGKHYLSYTFMVSDEAAALPASTKYTASLFVDLNSDGRYSRLAEHMDDATVVEFATGNSVKANELVAGTAYTLKRQIPESFRSVVPWKLEVSQTTDPLIRKSEIGYAGLEIKEAKEEIEILQILAQSGNTWDIKNDSQFTELMSQVKDFTIDMHSVTVNGFESQTEKSTYIEYLNQYDMLIIGFADCYGEFKNEQAVNAILQYINSGKSVLFTHDTTSFVNYSGNQFNRMDGSSGTMTQTRWGYWFNTRIRNAVGMDRYGITATGDYGNYLREGQILNDGTDKFEAVENSGKDMAYVVGSNRTQTYPETEGYVYLTLNLAKKELGNNSKYAESYDDVTITGITTEGADSGYAASNAIDKNTSTYWKDSINNSNSNMIYPYIGVYLNNNQNAGTYTLRYNPRSNNSNGRLKTGYIEVSIDGTNWTKAADVTGLDSRDERGLSFTTTSSFRYVRLVFTETFGNPANRYASAQRIRIRNSYNQTVNINSFFTNTEDGSNPVTNASGSDNYWQSANDIYDTYDSGIDPTKGFPWSSAKYNVDLAVGSQTGGTYILDYTPYAGAVEGNITAGKVYVLTNTGLQQVTTVSWGTDASKKTVEFTTNTNFTSIRIEVTGTSSATTANLNKTINSAEFGLQKRSADSILIGTTTQYYNLSEDSGVADTGNQGNGAFSSTLVTAVNSGQITSYPFVIPEEFYVSQTHSQYYQLDLEADKDQDGESDIVVWYCISDADNTKDDLYSASPNDVRNNYYIYSIGNIFYSGVGHSRVSSTEEKKLFINTMIAAYSAQISNPTVTALAEEDVSAQQAKTVKLPIEYSLKDDSTKANGYLSTEAIEFYYSVNDSNFVSGSIGSGNQKDIRVRYYLQTSDGTTIPNLGDGTIKGIDITSEVETTIDDVKVIGEAVESGKAYTAVWTPKSKTLAQYIGDKNSVSIYIHVSSTFDHYGVSKTQYGHDTIYIKKTNLFNLD